MSNKIFSLPYMDKMKKAPFFSKASSAFCYKRTKECSEDCHIRLLNMKLNGWLLVGCRFKADCLTRDLGLGGMPSVGVSLRDPSPYLSEFRRKPRKTTNGWVDKRDRGLNLVPPVFQFWVLPLVGPVLSGMQKKTIGYLFYSGKRFVPEG